MLFKNKLWQIVLRFSAFIVMIAVLLVSPIAAQEVSHGCLTLPTIDMVPATFGHGYDYFLLFAGEVIIITHIGTASEVVVNGIVTLTPGESYTYVVPSDGHYTFNINNYTGSGLVDTTVDCNPVTTPGGRTDSDESILPENPCPVFHDGRINHCDTFNPVVLYGIPDSNDNWGLQVYNADGSGLLFAVDSEVINAEERCPVSNTLIYKDEATGISLWNLVERSDGTCPFQLFAPMSEPGKWYIIIFDELYPNSYYESWTDFNGVQAQLSDSETVTLNPVDHPAAATVCRFLAISPEC